MAERSGYAGRITNQSAQEVKAVYTQPKGKSSTIKKGGDMRCKKSSK